MLTRGARARSRTIVVVVAWAAGMLLHPVSPARAQNLFCNGLPVTIEGTNRVDHLRGTGGDDVIQALGGDDDDDLFGNDNDDNLSGGGGTDMCDGGRDTDTVDATCEYVENVENHP